MSGNTPPPPSGGYGEYESAPPPPPPGGGYGGGYGGVPQGSPPPNHLVWAILSTLFCCLPLGIASIVFAAQVNGKWTSGDAVGAQEASKKARTFALWATIIGVVIGIIYLLLGLAGAISFNGSASTTSP